MPAVVLSLTISGLGRDLAKILAGFGLVVILGLAFTVSLIALALGQGQPSIATSAPVPVTAPSNREAATITVARSVLGVPYFWGGTTPQSGFDCSGLVQWAYGQVGIVLPRTAQEQFDATVRLNPSQLQPGDLLFFHICCQQPDWVTHVGIYVGDGQMIQAPDEGDVVRITSIDTPYWQGHFVGAGRVPDASGAGGP